MSRQRITFGIAIVAVVLAMAVVMAGCSGSGKSGNAAGAQVDTASFSVKGASKLVALSNTVAPTSTTTTQAIKKKVAAVLSGKPAPFEYQIVNQGLSDDEVRGRLRGKAPASSASQAQATPAPKGTNLLSIDAEGNASLAIDSNYMVKVMYSVTDPKGEYVYLALDTGYVNPDGNDYSQFIAKNNCAFFRVSIADNSATCVQEGVYVQPIDQKYTKTVSANVKPIQFDRKGNMYFPGTAFTTKCDDAGKCSLFVADWKPRIYRMSASDNSVIGLTQDNQVINYYLVMNTGEIAYQTIGETLTVDNQNGPPSQVNTSTLYVWQPSQSASIPNGTTINLTGTNLIDFFTVDNYNTIMYGNWSESGIRFAKPAVNGGVDKVSLETQGLCTTCNNMMMGGNGMNYAPKKVIVGDDGKLYGVFGPTTEIEITMVSGATPTAPMVQVPKEFDTYKVFQILPYLQVPRAEIKVPTGLSYLPINVWGGTPFQIGGGYLFYRETREKVGYGLYDVINMINLKTRERYVLLNEANTWYELYSWRLRGDRLYFSALDLARTVVISGEIDLTLFAANPERPQSEYMLVKDMASAIGATSRVQDIESLSALPNGAASGVPTVTKFYTNAENLTSASVEFSNVMDPSTTEPVTSMSDVTNNKNVEAMKVWINNFLHLMPDLDGLKDLASTTPLAGNTAYRIAIGATATDIAGTQLGATQAKTFRTKPTNGWYIAEEDTNRVAKFTTDKNPWSSDSAKYYNLNVFSASTVTSTPADFILQFRAKNSGYTGMRIVLLNSSPTLTQPFNNDWDRVLFDVRLAQCTDINYKYSWYDWYWMQTYLYSTWISNNCNDSKIFNGNWTYYRIVVQGGTISVSYSDTVEGPYTASSLDTNYFTNTPLFARDTATQLYQLFIGVNSDMSVDDLKVYDISAVPNKLLVDQNFTGRLDGTDGINISTPAMDGLTENVPNFVQGIGNMTNCPNGWCYNFSWWF